MRKTTLILCCTLIFFFQGLYGGNSKSKELKELRKQARKYHFEEGSINYEKALAKYETLAESGDYYGYTAQAAIYAGVHGEKYPKDYAKAKKLYEKAAANGEPVAFNALGRLYLHGHGVEQNYAKAEELFKEASLRGRYDADMQLGHMYRKGLGKEVNYAKAAEYYEESIRRGSPDAHYMLGKLYLLGQEDVFEADEEKAFYHLSKAVSSGVEAAYVDLARMYLEGSANDNFDRAIELLEQAVELGRGKASFDLGELYREGRGVVVNYQTAYDYYQQAIDDGYDRAHVGIGWLYCEGQSGIFPQDYIKAREAFESAIEAGKQSACIDLAELYLEGLGVEKDAVEAVRLLEEAAGVDVADSYYCVRAYAKLAKLYLDGSDVAYKPRKSLNYLKAGVKGNSKRCMYLLGCAYLEGAYGQEGEIDLSGKEAKGLRLLKRAAKRGHVLSQLRVALEYGKNLSDATSLRKARKFYQLAISSEASRAKVERAIEKGTFDLTAVNCLKLL